MPTKSEKTAAPAVDYSTLNACQKLQIARSKFLQAGVKKTGKNIHLEFMYFELQDIVPSAGVHLLRSRPVDGSYLR